MALARIQRSIVRHLHIADRLNDVQLNELLSSTDDLSGDALEKKLIEDYSISDFQILSAKAKAFNVSAINIRNYKIDERNFEFLEKDYCREKQILPIFNTNESLILAISDPFHLDVTEEVKKTTKLNVITVLAIPQEIQAKLKDDSKVPVSEGFSDVVDSFGEDYFEANDGEINEDDLEEESAPIIKLANRIIEDGYYSGGSDIHIEPFEKEARVRVRVDGVCQEKLSLPPKVSGALLARIKVMANLDIAEKRLPQDGRIVFKQFNKKGIDIDLRVSTAPLNHGEGAVMRILDKQKSTLPLPQLGFSEGNLELYRKLITRPYGMILHCGPTGSGKSMTLYSALNEINTPDRVIRTAEDPIEYTLPGLCQMQMHRQIGLTFAAALRSFLRQDPDVILVGEIRDSETAQIAIEAALTGHMLFSTLHTNDAPSSISRLTEMGIEPFMISASLICICAQRLMRRVCKSCKQQYTPEGREEELMMRAIQWNGPIYKASERGCPACGGSGMKGRVGIHEVMSTSEELVKGINAEMEAAKLKRISIRNGMRTLHQDSLLKAKDGLSTIREALTTVPADMEDLPRILNAKSLEEALID